MNEFWTAVMDALFWFLEGLLGSISAAVRFRTEVPWYQCLTSSLIVVALGFGGDMLFTKWRKAIRRRKNKGDPDRYE